MRVFFIILTGLLLFVAGGALAMGEAFSSGSWRYKMTVTVETPEGIKIGSAVCEISNFDSSLAPELTQTTNSADVKGEAVVVDLGDCGILFALLKGYKRGEGHPDGVLYDVFPSGHGGTTSEGIKFYRNLKDAKAVLQPTDYPVLVTFKDIKDPKTVTPVLEMKEAKKAKKAKKGYPLHYDIAVDHFEELFGKGVKLKEISIEITDEPVT